MALFFGDQRFHVFARVLDWQKITNQTLAMPFSSRCAPSKDLFDDAELKFTFLTDLQAVHYPDQKGAELAVVYHLHNWTVNSWKVSENI